MGFTNEQLERYSRHIILKEIGVKGQKKLLNAKVLIIGACLPQVYPEAFIKLTVDTDQIYSLCLESTHVNMAITKLSAVFSTRQLEKLTFASADRSPHCTQMHYIMHEIERTMKEHIPVESYVVADNEIIAVTEAAVDLSKSLSKLSKMINGSDENYEHV